jgi:alpha-tubulin suppressor-like RCC1 family protein
MSTLRKLCWLIASVAMTGCAVDTKGLVFDDDEYERLLDPNGNDNGDGDGDGADAGDAGDGGNGSGMFGDGDVAGDGDVGPDGGDGGLPTTCDDEGEVRCTPQGELQTCTNGDFETTDVCGGPGRCSASRELCLACAPGAFRCVEGNLEECDLAGVDFHVVAQCRDEDSCVADGLTGGCIVCEPDVFECSLLIPIDPTQGESSSVFTTDVLSCGGSGETVDRIDSCRLDASYCDDTTGSCLVCEPGSYRCFGAYLTPCAANGSEYDFNAQQDCQFAALCNDEDGQCDAAECDKNTSQCTAAGELEACGISGTWERVMTCSSQAACHDDYMYCEICVPGSTYCNGDAVYQCNSTGTAVLFSQQCEASACVEATNTASCNHAVCTGNGTYNTCSSNTVYQCADGTTTPTSTTMCTGSSPICYESNCVSCIPGEHRCGGSGGTRLDVCTDGSWNVVEDCDDTIPKSFCNDRVGACMPVNPGRYFCNADGDLTRVEADGDQWVYQDCNDDERCDADQGDCIQRLCTPGALLCQGDAVVECNAQGDDFDDVTRCSSAAMCMDGLGCLEPTAIAAGEAHTCVVAAAEGSEPGTSGVALCWGANDAGQLGTGGTLMGTTTTPSPVTLGFGQFDNGINGIIFAAFTDVCAGRDFSCAAIEDFEGGTDRFAACWGSNTFGQLGIDDDAPGPFNGISFGVSDGSRDASDDLIELMGVEQIACGANFACLLDDTGSVYCWGANDNGQLGIASTDPESRVAVQIQGHDFLQISAGGQHACGVKDDGSVWCWGAGMRGQLGNGAEDDANEPVEIGDLMALKTQLPHLGADFSILASAATPFRAFGGNLFGQLGNGSTMASSSPVNVQGLRVADVSQFASGSVAEHACAVDGDELLCWGANPLGQLGTGDVLDRNEPAASAMDGSAPNLTVAAWPKSVAVGSAHTCAIAADHKVYCWGHNGRRQLGTALAANPQLEPIAVDFQ